MSTAHDGRRSDRRLYGWAAVLFALVVFAGFSRTYYLKVAFDSPALPSSLVHFHGLVMTAWVALFGAQVWLIRSNQARTHRTLGAIGIGLAVLVVITGFLTAAALGRNGSSTVPAGIEPLAVMIFSMVDILLFTTFFAAAVVLRKRSADHKRFMLLSALTLVMPAVNRLPFHLLHIPIPLVFLGLPTAVLIGLVVHDKRRNGKLNTLFLAAAILFIVSLPGRLVLMSSDFMKPFALWVIGWAA